MKKHDNKLEYHKLFKLDGFFSLKENEVLSNKTI
jgi:hypothetical protein